MKNNTPRTILLVDDDADDRKYFSEALQEIDDTVECIMARDGEQALGLLNNLSSTLPDYIFLDLRMPRINGRQFLVQIKTDERLKAIPVIVYTTSKDVTESEELQRLGAIHFITKPTNTEEIYYLIAHVLEEQENQQNKKRS